MSLRVWLPLNGNFENRGLEDIAVTNNSGTFADGGKIGAKAFTMSAYASFFVPSLARKNIFSVSFWYKPISNELITANWCRVLVFTTYNTDGTSGALFRFESSYGSAASTYAISIHNNSGQPISSVGHTLTGEWDKWHHIVATSDGVNMKTYCDGQLIRTNTCNGGTLTGTVYMGYSGIRPDGLMNDVRIYDHALSTQEVKQIAQGLVLHFPLDRNGWGNENILPDSLTRQISPYQVTNYTRTSNITVSEWACLNAQKISGSGGTNLIVGIIGASQTSEDGVYYSYSVYVKNNHATKKIRFKTNNGGIYSDWVNPNEAKRITAINAIGNGTNYLAFNFVTETTGDAFDFTYWKPKIEKGDVVTTWCPNSNDAIVNSLNINNNIEYDISGFKNNGEKTTGLTYTSDTPKNLVATHIGATSQKIHVNNFITSGFGNSYSFSWWGKRSSNSPMFWGFSNGIRLNGMYLGNLWNTGDGSNNPIYKIGTTTQVTVPSLNVWHHYVMTGNGTKCYVYLDGELWGEAKTYKAISGTSLYINGWDGSTSYSHDNMDISDFRIYCTALSAADVKELYEYNGLG